MNRKIISRHFSWTGIVLIAMIGFSCNQPGSGSVIKRPIDVWAFRSVLDQKPRMLTIALNQNLWVAYNTVTASFYKAWQGGISGKLFTNSNITPAVEGAVLVTAAEGNPWRIVENGKELLPVVQYRGHRIKENSITLLYSITHNNHQIKVEESPEYFAAKDKVGLRRQFNVSGMQAGASLHLQMKIPGSVTDGDISTNGQLNRQTKTTGNKDEQGAVVADLALSANETTDFSIQLALSQQLTVPAEKMKTVGEIAESLINSNDCNNCHNREEKTIGPSYLSIAYRYDYSQNRIEELARKIISGGAGNWGKVPMTPHPDLDTAAARKMASYILLAGENKNKATKIDKLTPSATAEVTLRALTAQERKNDKVLPGIATNIYQFKELQYGFPVIKDDKHLVQSGYLNLININKDDLAELEGNIVIQSRGFIRNPKAGNIRFRSVYDCGLRLTINNNKVIEKSGYLVTAEEAVYLPAGLLPFNMEYYQRGHRLVSLQWKREEDTSFSVIAPEFFSFKPADVKEMETSADLLKIPGDGFPLENVHPACALSQARPDHFKPRVGAMDFLRDGRMVVCTWDSLGAVYIVDGVTGTDTTKMKVKRIAFGLAEVLGMKIVDNEIFVLQKQELTKLVDLDNDDIIDEYQTVCNTWTATDNFHEFAFGLVFKDGYFYCTLATALLQGGSSFPNQTPDRGKVIKISKNDGSYEVVAGGLRTPNGIGLGVDNQIFVSDNQGDWLPANKIVHVIPGAWYGSRAVDFEGTAGRKETRPVVYLPQDEIANSPSQPVLLDKGIYKNQLICGDITYGGLQRVFVEKIKGHYQGAVFQFTQGLEAGVNRLLWGPDGNLYIGGCGQQGNWAQTGKLQYGLQRLSFKDTIAFEMLAVRATADGFEIEFTKPLAASAGLGAGDYEIKQWYYKPTSSYGGPKIDEHNLRITKVSRSEDKKKIRLTVPGIKAGYVVYLRLKRKKILDKDEQQPWVTEAWYTMNNRP